MNAIQEKRHNELFEQIFNLETELENPDTSYEVREEARYKIRELEDEYRELAKQDCVKDGEHMKRITPSGGYDVCFNCGAKN